MPLKQQRRLSSSAKMFVVAVIALLYCPFFNVLYIGNSYVADTIIQIRIGLDMIAKKGLILNDLYSWHQNLNWSPHEEGWYFIAGLAYKAGGIAGVIILSAIFNYAMAIIIFKKNLETVSPYIVVLTAAIARCFAFPNYSTRPQLVSQLFFVVFVYIMLEDKISVIKKCIAFSVFAFLMSWFHGGMIPLFFVIFGVFIVIEVVFKQFKTAGTYLLGLLAGAVASILNPIGIGVWTYAFLGSQSVEVTNLNMEWQPKTFSIPEISILLLIFVGFAVDERLRNFDKKVITKLCFYCMFIIISCKYCRFMIFTALIIVMFCGEELQILLNWLNSNITKLDTKKFRLGDISNYILTAFCVGFMLFMTVFSWITYFPTNTFSDISAIAAYDEGVINVVKEKGYSRIYNSFNTGTWLAFYEIPVHIDNRTDLYLAEFSGTDYITGKMLIADIDEMNGFVDEYHPDALVLDLEPGTTDEYFAADLYASERYNVIYDNTVTSTYDPDLSYRWMVVEVVDTAA